MRYKRKKEKDMSTVLADNISLSSFIKHNKKKLYEEGRQNVNLNKDGKPTISRDDPWFNENEWDEHFQGLPKK